LQRQLDNRDLAGIDDLVLKRFPGQPVFDRFPKALDQPPAGLGAAGRRVGWWGWHGACRWALQRFTIDRDRSHDTKRRV